MPRFVDLTGILHGELLPLEVVGVNKYGVKQWRCRCIPCGREDVIADSNLLRTKQKVNCGCTWGKRHTKHGFSKSPEYNAYYDAQRRCREDKNYVGRIKFLFTSFEQFLAELGPRPDSGLSLDRINNDGNYEPGNVRWATRTEQNNNQRTCFDLQQRINELEAEVARLKSLLR